MNQEEKVKKVLPMVMLVFISSASMINVFNIISPQLTVDFAIDSATVSLLSMIAMLMVGVFSVIYSTLSDYISIKRLMLFGIILLNTGSLLAFIFSNSNFYVLLIASAMLIAGGTCGSGLMIIIATRYLKEKEHSKYYGYCTACVSASQACGILLGGFFATYVGWKYVYLIPIISLVALPSILKNLPDDSKKEKGKLDVVGLSILTAFTVMISLYFNYSKPINLLISIILLIILFVHITKSKNAFISIDLFKNSSFVTLIILVFFILGIQAAFSFLFSFMARDIYNVTLDKVSLIILPSYIIASLVGMVSGNITEKFGSLKTLFSAITFVIISLIVGAIGLDKNIFVLALCACMFAAGFALVYSPFMKLVISKLEPKQIGAGVGFFNLIASIGPSIMISFTGKLMVTDKLRSFSFGLVNDKSIVFSNILFIYAIILVIALIVLSIAQKKLKIEKEIK